MVVGLEPHEASDRLTMFQVLFILKYFLMLIANKLTTEGFENESRIAEFSLIYRVTGWAKSILT